MDWAELIDGLDPAAKWCATGALPLRGMPDAYLDAGALPTLHDRYGISTEALSGRLKAWLG